MITLRDAERVVFLHGRVKELRALLKEIAGSRPISGKMILSAQVVDSGGWSNSKEFKIEGAKFAETVLGYVRQRHELALAECIRELNRLGAEIPQEPHNG